MINTKKVAEILGTTVRKINSACRSLKIPKVDNRYLLVSDQIQAVADYLGITTTS